VIPSVVERIRSLSPNAVNEVHAAAAEHAR